MLAYPALLSRSYRHAILDTPNLEGYWRLGEMTGTVAKDECGKNNGTYTGGPTLGAPGPLSGAPSTSATFSLGKYVNPFTALISPYGTRTVVAWIYPTATTEGGIVSTRGGGFVLDAHRSSSGNLTYYHTGGALLQVAGGITTGSWHMVAATFDLTPGAVVLYRNAAVVGSATGFAIDFGGISSGGIIGDLEGSFTTPFVGSIAHVAIWSRVLPQAELANLYRIGRGF